MTTDNRTNESTPEQVEAAARKWIERLDSDAHWARSPGAREKASSEKKILEWLLEAAAGVAPQAESGHDWMTWEESGKNGTYCRNCGRWAGKSGGEACAPVQPSSTVDEAAHDAEVAAKALEDAADRCPLPTVGDWLRARAAEYRKAVGP